MGSPGQGLGGRVDIHVDAFGTDPAERLRVLVEVKASWNKNLVRDLAAQLAQRYLIQHGTTYGVYLVGVFDSPRWDETDSRSKRRPSIGSLRKRLAGDLAKYGSEIDVRLVILDCSLGAN